MRITAAPQHVDWTGVKARRNFFLGQTDKFVSVVDFPITDEERQQVVEYRARLRSMFDGLTHPDQAEFPDPPPIAAPVTALLNIPT